MVTRTQALAQGGPMAWGDRPEVLSMPRRGPQEAPGCGRPLSGAFGVWGPEQVPRRCDAMQTSICRCCVALLRARSPDKLSEQPTRACGMSPRASDGAQMMRR